MNDPFKLKKDFIPDYRALNLAQEIFGTPVDGMVHVNPPKCESNWKFFDSQSIINLNISQVKDSDRIDIIISQEPIYSDKTISINLKDFIPEWQDKFKKFISVISKPWNEWTEEEIICDPMWIYFFWKSNRSISEKFQNAMVLFSYQNSHNSYVRKYFDENKEEARGSC